MWVLPPNRSVLETQNRRWKAIDLLLWKWLLKIVVIIGIFLFDGTTYNYLQAPWTAFNKLNLRNLLRRQDAWPSSDKTQMEKTVRHKPRKKIPLQSNPDNCRQIMSYQLLHFSSVFDPPPPSKLAPLCCCILNFIYSFFFTEHAGGRMPSNNTPG